MSTGAHLATATCGAYSRIRAQQVRVGRPLKLRVSQEIAKEFQL